MEPRTARNPAIVNEFSVTPRERESKRRFDLFPHIDTCSPPLSFERDREREKVTVK